MALWTKAEISQRGSEPHLARISGFKTELEPSLPGAATTDLQRSQGVEISLANVHDNGRLRFSG